MKNIFKIEINDRIFGLDLLRTFAISFVVIEHASGLLPAELVPINKLFVFDGVTIFFVLSGFLIGSILLKSINRNGISISVITNFWIRRWFRTLPNYFLILIIICVLHLLTNEDFDIRSVSRYFYFSRNIFTEHPGFFLVAWSLSIEEWFYLLLPLFLSVFTFMFTNSIQKAVLFTCIFVIIGTLLFRYYRYMTVPLESFDDWDLIFRKQVITRIDSLMYGVLGAYIKFYRKKVWQNHKRQLLVVGILLFVFSNYIIPKITSFNDIYNCVFSFSITSISTFLLLPYLSEFTYKRNHFTQSITYISLISYSIYLIHFSIVYRFLMIPSLPWYLISDNEYIIAFFKYIIYLIVVILSSILLYKYYEVPMTALRDQKIFNRKRR